MRVIPLFTLSFLKFLLTILIYYSTLREKHEIYDRAIDQYQVAQLELKSYKRTCNLGPIFPLKVATKSFLHGAVELRYYTTFKNNSSG